ncbi:hypothetical protein [Bradyrhizobium cenepequi]|uniref:hypothetical protein n=1 Tax=Bradyrhizobium cenepequi TaxID=2821403 RepID=UPI001CE2CEC4|nr:hypothetical protein [Bradyrhizobium cenepequi]MCA6109999.1 hypothetical protein [Bradyrhizobium cenepequi]
MPVGRYIAWVGASLLVLMYIVDWCSPQSLTEAPGDPVERPAIRIASVERPPELVVIDTSLPTIVPPPTLAEPVTTSEPPPVRTLATAPSPPVRALAAAPPPPPAVEVEKKTKKVVKRQAPKVAALQPPLPLAPAVAPASPAPAAAPEIKLSFADIISGQLVKNLLNLH